LIKTLQANFVTREWLALTASALVVHLWLPLFSISAGFLRAVIYSVGWGQWLLKNADQHPFKAVGFVAATIVFVGTIIMQRVFS
jgi:hypothetical protein